MSVTGEAVTTDLVRRWFAAQPQVELVNAYGLTETSDDTNHEVMDRVPEGELVPLGRPVANVHLYVVDEHLAPVPLGAPGEIVFSGICVGRGYVNDPEQTRASFLPDPHRDGERLYRSGDRGRWRPDGKLEFLGRRDSQVKISGFRIELGEVERALARAPGVGQAAVVVAGGGGAAKRLVGFYSGPRPLATGALRSRLAESLPRYMVPSALHWRRELPLTANGKVDRKALLALDGELAGADATARSGTSSGVPATTAVPAFAVISGAEVQASLEGREREIVELVETAYRLHVDGDAVSPATHSMRFPDRPTARINALPASLGGDVRAHGLKWISSFPENVAAGIPRASAVVILNGYETGYPFACVEGSIISAARTAAFAALAADRLSEGARPARVGFFGAGLIARYVHTYLAAIGWPFEAVGVHDLSAESAAGFRGYLERSVPGEAITVHESAEGLIRSSDLVVFATVASEPHVGELSWFDHNPLVLHLSLRDLAPEIVLASTNIVDDVDHCLAGNTSPHLAERLTGNRDFIDATLGDVMAGRVKVPAGRPLLFSPYGLGVLDLALARYVHDRLAEADGLRTIDGFFHELSRHGERPATR